MGQIKTRKMSLSLSDYSACVNANSLHDCWGNEWMPDLPTAVFSRQAWPDEYKWLAYASLAVRLLLHAKHTALESIEPRHYRDVRYIGIRKKPRY